MYIHTENSLRTSSPLNRTVAAKLSEMDDTIGGNNGVGIGRRQNPITDEIYSNVNTGRAMRMRQCSAYGPAAQPKVGGVDETGEYELDIESFDLPQRPAYGQPKVGGADETGEYELDIESFDLPQRPAYGQPKVGGPDETGEYELDIESFNLPQRPAYGEPKVGGADEMAPGEYELEDGFNLPQCSRVGGNDETGEYELDNVPITTVGSGGFNLPQQCAYGQPKVEGADEAEEYEN